MNFLRDKEAMNFSNLKFLVFDEADEIFDQNFRVDIESFMTWAKFTAPGQGDSIGKTIRLENRNACQVLMFSATFAPAIEKYSKIFFRDYHTAVKVRMESHTMTQSERQVNTAINEQIIQEIIAVADYTTDIKRRPEIVKGNIEQIIRRSS